MTLCGGKKCHRMVPGAAIFSENGAKIFRTFQGRWRRRVPRKCFLFMDSSKISAISVHTEFITYIHSSFDMVGRDVTVKFEEMLEMRVLAAPSVKF